MKIYIAAPWIHRDTMPAIATELESYGATITHKWWETESDKVRTVEDHQWNAYQDKVGVQTADAVLVINSASSEGKAVEQGIALGLGIPIFIVGTRGEHSKNIFHYLSGPSSHQSGFTWCPTLEEGIAAIIKHGVSRYERKPR